MIREKRKEGMEKERGRLDGMSYKKEAGRMWVMGVGCQSATGAG